jgi:subtilase family serine protease
MALAATTSATAARRPAVSNLPPGLSPQQLHAAYELPPTTQVSPSQTIAVIELGGDPTLESDLAVYDKRYGLPSCTRANGCLRVVNQEGGSSLPANSFRAGEVAIDIEGAHAICENCHLLVVEGNPTSGNWIGETGAEVNTAIREGATEVSICIELFGAASEAEETAFLTATNAADFDHPGVVITVASGDCGYDESNDPEHWSFCAGLRWDYPSFPAKSPTVIGVGGTSLGERGGAWTSSVWAQGGSGCSAIFAAPSWQSSVAGWGPTGCGGRRLDVDVSAIASPRTGPGIYNTTPAGDWSQAGWGRAGGTSVAAPIVAAEFALAGGAHGVRYPAQTLYSHAGDSSAFEDVTEGTNGSCGASTICNATIGYDGPSGLGSPIGLRAFSQPGAPVETTAPTITGAATRGHLLTARVGSWTGNPSSFGEQWEVCNRSGTGCLPIQGATGSRFRLTAGDANRAVRVMVTVGNSSGFGAPGFALARRVYAQALKRP